ncbi:uncharacterized protein LOC124253581 [Haliotis rubra]|uniref:uncharacterized protein LOC124253581 n=1 Tax=Haliotis rubra TaxID=36100 RepID=UPI001EE5C2D9|nr:uncharacterized protein LOC124253581 [Haliotis rubra]
MEDVLCYLSLMSVLLSNTLGQTVSLQGSSSSVLLGDSFQLTCTVTGGGPLQGTLSFQRGAGATPYRPCIVNSRTCAQFTGDPGYSCGCVTGQTRIFYTNITAVSRNDSNNWTCQDSNSISNTISMTVQWAPSLSPQKGQRHYHRRPSNPGDFMQQFSQQIMEMMEHRYGLEKKSQPAQVPALAFAKAPMQTSSLMGPPST